MKGDATVIEHLNKALRLELTAVNQYWLHFRLVEDWGYAKLAKKERAESIEEMQHADKLAARIIFLEGLPNMQQLNPLRIGQTVREVLEADLAGEYEAQKAYSRGARGLPGRRRLRLDGSLRGAAQGRGRPHQLPREPAPLLRPDRRRELRPAPGRADQRGGVGVALPGRSQQPTTCRPAVASGSGRPEDRHRGEPEPRGSNSLVPERHECGRLPRPPPPGELHAKPPRRAGERREPGERRKFLHDDRRRHPVEQPVVRRLVDEGRAEGAAFQRRQRCARRCRRRDRRRRAP